MALVSYDKLVNDNVNYVHYIKKYYVVHNFHSRNIWKGDF